MLQHPLDPALEAWNPETLELYRELENFALPDGILLLGRTDVEGLPTSVAPLLAAISMPTVFALKVAQSGPAGLTAA